MSETIKYSNVHSNVFSTKCINIIWNIVCVYCNLSINVGSLNIVLRTDNISTLLKVSLSFIRAHCSCLITTLEQGGRDASTLNMRYVFKRTIYLCPAQCSPGKYFTTSSYVLRPTMKTSVWASTTCSVPMFNELRSRLWILVWVYCVYFVCLLD